MLEIYDQYGREYRLSDLLRGVNGVRFVSAELRGDVYRIRVESKELPMVIIGGSW